MRTLSRRDPAWPESLRSETLPADGGPGTPYPGPSSPPTGVQAASPVTGRPGAASVPPVWARKSLNQSSCDATDPSFPTLGGATRIDSKMPGSWRCPDAEANCSNFGRPGCVSTSACVGGTDVDALCEPSLGETFCQACDRSNTSVEVYFVRATDERVAHCKPCGAAAMNNLLVPLAVVVGLVIALFGALALRRCVGAQRLQKFDLVARQLALKNKAKIVIGFYMIATRVPRTYDVSLPADVRRLLEQMTLIVSLGMKGVETTPLECMGLAGYVPRLLAWMILPLVVTAVILLGVGGRRYFRAKQKEKQASESSKSASEDASHGGSIHVNDSASEDASALHASLLESVTSLAPNLSGSHTYDASTRPLGPPCSQLSAR